LGPGSNARLFASTDLPIGYRRNLVAYLDIESKPGDQTASVNYSDERMATWAHLARLHIIAKVYYRSDLLGEARAAPGMQILRLKKWYLRSSPKQVPGPSYRSMRPLVQERAVGWR